MAHGTYSYSLLFVVVVVVIGIRGVDLASFAARVTPNTGQWSRFTANSCASHATVGR